MESSYLSCFRMRESITDERRNNGDLKNDYRSPIESDYGRLVFSSAFRRLHDKTQVFPLTTNDNIHSRLTHSIEVASVGKSFALKICKDRKVAEKLKLDVSNIYDWKNVSTLMEVICLAHDIGNPPLGHFGETAIQNYFSELFEKLKCDLENNNMSNFIIQSERERQCVGACEMDSNNWKNSICDFINKKNLTYYDYTQFDGNAEGFRILTKLQFLNDLFGLNLTAASLAAGVKYPNFAGMKRLKKTDDGYNICLSKHGIFYTEKEYLNIIMKNCGLANIGNESYRRHPFSYLMEAADSICYLLMDIEDAISKGWLSYSDMKIMLQQMKLGKAIVSRAGNHFKENDPPKKKIVQLRTELMSSMVETCFDNFKKNLDKIIEGNYNRELLFEKDGLGMLLQEYSRINVYNHKEIETLELTGSAVISGLLDYYIKYLFHRDESYRMHAKHILSKSVFMATLQEHLYLVNSKQNAWDEYEDFDPKDLTFEEKFRIVRDHVACMTDKYALEQFRKISGQQI